MRFVKKLDQDEKQSTVSELAGGNGRVVVGGDGEEEGNGLHGRDVEDVRAGFVRRGRKSDHDEVCRPCDEG